MKQATKSKLELLQQEADDATALVAAARRAMTNLEIAVANATNAAAAASNDRIRAAAEREIAGVEADLAAARDTVEARTRRARSDAQLLAQLRDYLQRQPEPQLVVTKPNGVSIPDIRQRIGTLQRELDQTRQAPPDTDELRAEVRRLVTNMVARAAPFASVLGPKLTFQFPLDPRAPDDIVALLAWSDPEQMCSRLEAALPPPAAGALTAATRSERIAQLEGDLLAAEQMEEALILTAHNNGQSIARRPNADPRAVLGTRVRAA